MSHTCTLIETELTQNNYRLSFQSSTKWAGPRSLLQMAGVMKIILDCGVFRIQEDFSPTTSFEMFKNKIKVLFGSWHLWLDFHDKSLETLDDNTLISEKFAEDDCITFRIREEYDNKHPLHFAAEALNLDAARRWIAAGTPVDIKDHHDKTPLL